MKVDLENVKSYFLKFSRKEQKGKQPIPKEVKKKTANAVVLGSLGLLLSLSLLGAVRSLLVSSRVDETMREIELLKQSSEGDEVSEELDVSKVQYYMSNFLYYYVNVDASKKDDRRKVLGDYFSFELSSYADDVKENRVLKTQRIISLEEVDDHMVAYARISYELGKETFSEILVIPFRISDGLLAIVSPVYAVAEDLYQGESEALTRIDHTTVNLLSSEDQESIAQFLPVFFEKYASSNETDLNLLMKTPFFMGGNYRFKSFDTNTVLYYEKDEKNMVQVAVEFENKNSGAIHIEHFTIQLVRQDTGWYVEELYHYYKN